MLIPLRDLQTIINTHQSLGTNKPWRDCLQQIVFSCLEAKEPAFYIDETNPENKFLIEELTADLKSSNILFEIHNNRKKRGEKGLFESLAKGLLQRQQTLVVKNEYNNVNANVAAAVSC